MQYLVAALYAVQALFIGSLPLWYIRWMTQWADSMNNQQLNPSGQAPPADLLANLDREMTVAFYVAVVVLFAICVLALIGALARLMWAFYVILGLLCLETLYLGLGAVDSILTSAVGSIFLGQSIGPPAWIAWAQVGFAIPSAALFVWMLVATVRRGPWAMRNANAARPAAGGTVQPA
jgi:nitrate reductase NapE component